MENVYKMFLYFFMFFLDALSIALLVRAVLSWFIHDEESKIMMFLILITEPAVGLVRGTIGRVFEKYASPIDFSYILTVVIVEVLNIIVGSLL